MHEVRSAPDARRHSSATVRIALPADPSYVRTLRFVVGDAAARAGFVVDVIDDIRLAVTELCCAVISAQSTTITVEAVADRREILVIGRVDDAGSAQPELDAVAAVVVDVIADACSMQRDGDVVTFTFAKRAVR